MSLPGNGIPIRLRTAAALALLPLLAVTACGSGGGAPAVAGAQVPSAPADDPVAGVRPVDSVAALLPAEVRKTGTLRVGSSVGAPPAA
ncbi:hypothetical protein ACH4XT_39100 [Streptomyces avidinii]